MSTFRAAFQAIFLWLFLCIVGSIAIIGMAGGGHGSVIFLMVGAFTGLCGAVAHVFLLTKASVRTHPKRKQIFLVSALTAAICLVFGFALYLHSENGDFDFEHFKVALILLAWSLVGIVPVTYVVSSSLVLTKKIIDVEAQREFEKN